MREADLLEELDIKITTDTLTIGNQVYSMNNIISVDLGESENKCLLIFGWIISILGIVNIFKTGGIVISIFMIIAGIIMINIPKQYFVILNTIENEIKILQNTNIKYLENILKSIKKVHQNYIACDDCLGNGFQNDTSPVDCFMCNQQGKISLEQGFFNVQQPCPMCLGYGKLYKDACSKCSGQGYFKTENTHRLSIVDQLKEIVTLRQNGSLSEEEFHQLRERIIANKFHS